MRIAAFSPVFNEEKLMRGCIGSFRDYCDMHLIMNATHSLYGDQVATDNTESVAENLGATVWTSKWKTEQDQRNQAVHMLREYDWILVNDADMWFQHDMMDNLMEFLPKCTSDAIVAPQYSYWYDTDHRLIGDDFMPVIAMRPSARFTHIACLDCNCQIFPWHLHHLAWCQPKDILKKVQTYGHSNEFKDPVGWYNQHFKTWKEGQKAHMPDKIHSVGEDFDVERNPLPKELYAYL